MAYPSSSPSGPNLGADLTAVIPYMTTLKDGTRVVLDRALRSCARSTDTHYCGPDTLESMRQLLNFEIRAGDTYPFEGEMTMKHFLHYFFAFDVFLLRVVANTETPAQRQTTDPSSLALKDPALVGCFYIKPNYPGRCSHVCNGGFLVAPQFRGAGAGRIMGERYRHLAKALGYRGSMFNLVFDSNKASNALWGPLGFTNVGRVPAVGRLRIASEDRGKLPPARTVSSSQGEEAYYDALMWFYDLTKEVPWLPAKWETNPKVIRSTQALPASRL